MLFNTQNIEYFDEEFYIEKYPNVANYKEGPYNHYILHGKAEGRSPNSEYDYLFKSFDKEFYLSSYPDVKNYPGSAFQHYILHGIHEGRFIRKKIEKVTDEKINTIKFDESFYLKSNPSIALSSLSPVEHYLKYGINEGRLPFSINKENYISHNELAEIKDIGSTSIAVHIHVFYTHLLDEIITYLNNIPFPYSLFISVLDKKNQTFCYKKLIGSKNIQLLDIRVVKNIGEHLYPLINIFKEEIKNYDYLCHIYTKNLNNKRYFLYGWSEYLWSMLLGSEEIVRKNLLLLKQKNIGLVFPEPYYLLKEKDISLENYLKKNNESLVSYILSQFSLTMDNIRKNIISPSGGMFWAKTDSLKLFFEKNFNKELIFNQNKLDQKLIESILRKLIGNISLNSGYSNYILLNNFFNEKIILDEVNDKNFNKNVKNFIAKNIFDPQYYLDSYFDVYTKKVDPIKHYLNHGILELRRPCGSIKKEILRKALKIKNKKYNNKDFDPIWYLSTYYKIGEIFLFSNIDPYKHYLDIGKLEGKQPNRYKIDQYLIENSDFCLKHNEIKISIIVPVYNSAIYLIRCLNSLIAQTMKDIEIIIINDGSPDHSQSIIDIYTKQYSNIKCIRHKKNTGLVQTHKDGISAAQGKYFTIVDGDDWIDKRFCEIMYFLAEAYQANLVCCKHIRNKKGPNKINNFININELHVLEGKNILNSIGLGIRNKPNIHYGLNRKLHLKKSWIEIDPLKDLNKSLVDAEDHIATIRFCSSITRVVTIENQLYNWYLNDKSVTNNELTIKALSQRLEILKRIYIEKRFTQIEIHEKNSLSLIISELYPKIAYLLEIDINACRKILIFLAKYIDKNKFIFSNDLLSQIKQVYTPIFIKTIENRIKIKNFILFVDQKGMIDIKKYVIPYWHSKIDIKYISLNDNLSMINVFRNNIYALSCKLIIASGGWDQKILATNRPIIQLWHGMGALKKVLPSKNFPVKKLYCSSQYVKFAYENIFKIKKENILSFGTVQSDYFLDNKVMGNCSNEFYNKYTQLKYKKIYVWCPTFRSYNGKFYPPPMINLKKMQHILDNEVFIYKLHPVLVEFLKKNSNKINFFENKKNIINANDSSIDELISVADVFVTDYSSCIFYAALRNIPMVFYAPDIYSYQYNPGLEINYMENMPGEIVTSNDINHIINSLRNANSKTKKYQDFKKYHLESCDGFSKERIFSDIITTYFQEKYIK